MTIERKMLTGLLKSLDAKGSGVAVIATLTLTGAPPVIDKDGDMTLPGAFGEAVVPFLVSHDWSEVPAGKAWIREEADEARAYFQINLGTSKGKDLYEALRFDLSRPPAKTEFSYGFTIPPGGAEFRTLEDGRRVRVLKRLQVHEVSSVIAGAGVGTRLVAVKDAEHLEDPIGRLISSIRNYDREALTAHLETLPQEQRDGWMLQAQGLLAEMNFLVTTLEFDALTEGKQFYRFVPHEPWDGRVSLAKSVVAAACTELGAGFPKSVRFFTSTDEERADFMHVPNLYGLCSKDGVISLSWNLMPAEIIHAAAHEAVHFVMDVDEDAADAFAEEFARRHSAKLLGTSPRPAVAVDPVIVSAAEAKELRKRYGLEIPYMYVNV